MSKITVLSNPATNTALPQIDTSALRLEKSVKNLTHTFSDIESAEKMDNMSELELRDYLNVAALVSACEPADRSTAYKSLQTFDVFQNKESRQAIRRKTFLSAWVSAVYGKNENGEAVFPLWQTVWGAGCAAALTVFTVSMWTGMRLNLPGVVFCLGATAITGYTIRAFWREYTGVNQARKWFQECAALIKKHPHPLLFLNTNTLLQKYLAAFTEEQKKACSELLSEKADGLLSRFFSQLFALSSNTVTPPPLPTYPALMGGKGKLEDTAPVRKQEIEKNLSEILNVLVQLPKQKKVIDLKGFIEESLLAERIGFVLALHHSMDKQGLVSPTTQQLSELTGISEEQRQKLRDLGDALHLHHERYVLAQEGNPGAMLEDLLTHYASFADQLLTAEHCKNFKGFEQTRNRLLNDGIKGQVTGLLSKFEALKPYLIDKKEEARLNERAAKIRREQEKAVSELEQIKQDAAEYSNAIPGSEQTAVTALICKALDRIKSAQPMLVSDEEAANWPKLLEKARQGLESLARKAASQKVSKPN